MNKKRIISIIIFLAVMTCIVFAILFNHKLYNDSDMEIHDTVFLVDGDKEVKIDVSDLKHMSQSQISIVLYFSSIEHDDVLHFYSTNSTAVFYSDDAKIEYRYDENQKLYEVKLVDLTSVTINFTNCEDGIRIDKFFIADASEFTTYLLVKDMFYITLILVALFSSIIVVTSVLLYSLLKRNVTLLFGYTVLFILLSLWCLTNVNYFQYIFADYISLHQISTYVVFLLPIGILIASESIIYKSKFKRIYQIVLCVLSLSCAILLSLHSFNVINISSFNNLGLSISTILLITMAIAAYYGDKMSESNDNELLFRSTIALLIGLVLEMLVAIFSFIGYQGIAITLSLLTVFAISLNSIILNYVKVENNRRYLSEENERLTSSILLSQIKPHFLYNALNSISYLCKKNPAKADVAVVKFSRYLRQNMKSIEDTDMIEFVNEVEHIKNYLYLEQIRFPNIEFKFEIKFDDFEIPPLCIQPIVENSVKHGASKNPDGGFVCLKSYRTDRFIVIEVADNGIGFDDQRIIKGTGLSNISRRFAMHLNADVEFQSQIGKGTVVRVKIPRKDIG